LLFIAYEPTGSQIPQSPGLKKTAERLKNKGLDYREFSGKERMLAVWKNKQKGYRRNAQIGVLSLVQPAKQG
jgi:hypothetical protein